MTEAEKIAALEARVFALEQFVTLLCSGEDDGQRDVLAEGFKQHRAKARKLEG